MMQPMVVMMVVELLENARWRGEQVPCGIVEASRERFVRVQLGFVLEIAFHLVAGLKQRNAICEYVLCMLYMYDSFAKTT